MPTHLPMLAAMVLALGIAPLGASHAAQLVPDRAMRYPDLATEMDMSEERAGALMDFLDSQMRRASPLAILNPPGEMQEQQKADLAAYLGPENYARWQRYELTIEGRRRIVELQRIAQAMGQPLTDLQVERLTGTVVEEQLRRAREEDARANPSGDQLAQLTIDEQNLAGREASFQRTMDSARTYLKPEQFAIMERAMSQQIQVARTQLENRRLLLGSEH